jgi:hypothetical protein
MPSSTHHSHRRCTRSVCRLVLATCMGLAIGACASGPPMDPAQLASLRQQLEPKGWSYLHTDTVHVESAVFLERGSLAREGTTVRARLLKARAATASSGIGAIVHTLSVDCGQRTLQLLALQPYADPLSKQPLGRHELAPTRPHPVTAGSPNSKIVEAVCDEPLAPTQRPLGARTTGSVV